MRPAALSRATTRVTRPRRRVEVQYPESRGRGGRRLAVALAAAALLAGCAARGGFENRMDGYVGQPVEAAKAKIGEGYAERTLPDGRRVITWTWYESGTSPGYRPPDTHISLGESGPSGARTVIAVPREPPRFDDETSGLCEVSFIADSGGTIVDWRAIGTSCRSRVP